MIEIIHSVGNCFIGEWNPGTLILKNPRVVQKNPAGGYAMGKIIGEPKEVKITGAIVCTYEPTERALVDRYVSDVTGIQIVSKIQEVK